MTALDVSPTNRSPRRDASGRRDAAPTLDRERAFWEAGLHMVAGVDEVGRGALAGPLVAAAVVLPACGGSALRGLRSRLAGVRDSKRLAPLTRESLAERIGGVALAVSVGLVASDELDEIGIVAANRRAMERAVGGLAVLPDALLLDAVLVDLDLPQSAPIRADACCLSVAAAAIVAKVARDAMMVSHHAVDPRYGYAAHKGYGTATHLAAIRAHGPSPLHRRSFALPPLGAEVGR